MWPAVPTTTDRMGGPLLPRRAFPPAGTLLAARGAQVPFLLRLGFASTRTPALFRRARRLQDLEQAEIDLPALQIHLHDLDLDAIAEPVDLAGVLPPQHVQPLLEAVIVVRHRRDVHQALDEVLDELDEQPEGRYPGNVAVELVADLVGHEPYFLPLHELALGIVGAALALG